MALLETDILIEPTDFKIINGDMAIGDVNNENINHIIIANPGQFLISPTIGGSLYKSQNASTNDARFLAASLRSQLRGDGYDSVRFSGVANTETGEVDLSVTAERTLKPKRQAI